MKRNGSICSKSSTAVSTPNAQNMVLWNADEKNTSTGVSSHISHIVYALYVLFSDTLKKQKDGESADIIFSAVLFLVKIKSTFSILKNKTR